MLQRVYDFPNWVTGIATFSVKSSYQYPGVECLNPKDLQRHYPLSLIPLHLTAGALFLYSTLAYLYTYIYIEVSLPALMRAYSS